MQLSNLRVFHCVKVTIKEIWEELGMLKFRCMQLGTKHNTTVFFF